MVPAAKDPGSGSAGLGIGAEAREPHIWVWSVPRAELDVRKSSDCVESVAMGVQLHVGVALSCLAGWAAVDGDEPISIDGPALEVRAEYFAMRPLGATSEADPVGLIALRRIQRPGGDLLECELLFGDGELRVLHTEGESLGGTRLVWRELGPAGRSWLAEWIPSSGMLKTTEYSQAKEIHRHEHVGELNLPLALVEECREDRIGPETLTWLSPSAASPIDARLVRREDIPQELPVWAFGGEKPQDLRWVQLVSGQDVELASYIFQGEVLLGVQWGAGSPWALPIGEREWRAAQEAWHARRARHREAW